MVVCIYLASFVVRGVMIRALSKMLGEPYTTGFVPSSQYATPAPNNAVSIILLFVNYGRVASSCSGIWDTQIVRTNQFGSVDVWPVMRLFLLLMFLCKE